MRSFPTSQGVPYWSEEVELPDHPRPMPLWLTALLFVSAFALLQWAWSEARGTAVERLVVDGAIVKTAAALIDVFTPAVGVEAVGSRLKANGGGINILNGCEGLDAAFLLACAMLIAPMTWRVKLLGLVAGSLVVFVLNQGRILALFYAYRADRALFDMLHGAVTPLLLIVATGVFFLVWLQRFGLRHVVKPSA